ncbi:perforin-1-like [Symphorus nematophorus]
MARLWHLMLLCWAWSPLCLPSRVHFIGTPQECEKAHFVPGYNLGGEGFDIVTMEPKSAYVIDTETWKLGSNGTCRLYRNDYMNGTMQKVPAAVVNWRIFPKCSLKVSSTVYDSVEALVNDSTASVSNDWKGDLNLPADITASFGTIYGGSHSKESVFGMKKSKQDHYTFLRHSVNCNYYRYSLATKPPLSHEFESAVNSLPPYSCQTASSYRSLIDTYGTHYITQVFLGGEMKAVTSIKTCQATMNGLSATEVSDCLLVEASASFAHPDSIKPMMQQCQEKKKKLSIPSYSSMFDERNTEVIGGDINGADILFTAQSDPSVYKRWLKSLKNIPEVVRYNLKPLHIILPDNHPARAGLKQEVEQYIKKNAVLKKCSENCTIGQRSSKRDPCACVCISNPNVKYNCCPAGKGLALLKVYNLYARGLYGDIFNETHGSVEVRYGNQVKRTPIIQKNVNPRWKTTFEFGPIQINMNDRLTFRVYNQQKYWNSELLGKCSFNLRRGRVIDDCMLNHGTFFFSYIVQCAPNLGGQQCQEYIPTPMSPALAKVFHTRDGVLAGESRKQCDKSDNQSG